jgi:hypothetical protein
MAQLPARKVSTRRECPIGTEVTIGDYGAEAAARTGVAFRTRMPI